MDKGNNIQSDNIVSQGHNRYVTMLQCNIKCSGNVLSSIDSGCSDVVQDGKISLEIADAAWSLH